MNKLIIIVLFFIISTNVVAQQFYVEAGKTIATFDYKNSQGFGLDNLQSSSHSFMAIGYRDQVFLDKLNGTLGARYAGYGAIGSDDASGNYFEWDVNYLEFVVGVDYELFTYKNTEFFIKGTTSLGILLQGTQIINNSVIDLKSNDEFDKPLIDFKIGAGIAYPISRELSIYMQYMYGKSLTTKEVSSTSGNKEELKIVSNNISFGLLINLFN